MPAREFSGKISGHASVIVEAVLIFSWLREKFGFGGAPDNAERAVRRKRSQAGNIFFTLFGAVALVGVVGVSTSTLMRGPVGTVIKLNQKSKAEAEMQIAQKLAMMEAAQQADDGDCDADSFVSRSLQIQDAALAV